MNNNKNEYQKSRCKHKVENVDENVVDKKLAVEPTQGIHQNSKKSALSEDFLRLDNVEAVLAIFCFYVCFKRF